MKKDRTQEGKTQDRDRNTEQAGRRDVRSAPKSGNHPQERTGRDRDERSFDKKEGADEMSGSIEKRNIEYLENLSDYEVASGYPDIRGWEVKAENDKPIGTVDGLIVNRNTERVIYLDVKADESLMDAKEKPRDKDQDKKNNKDQDQDDFDHFLIPIGLVRLDKDNEYVIANKVNYETFRNVTRRSRGFSFTPDYELSIYTCYFPGERQEKTIDDRFYDRPAFNGRSN